MKYPLELLKQLFFVICEVVWTIIKTVAIPLYTTSVKVCLIALSLWILAKYVPHGLPYVHDVSYLGWVTAICMYRIFTSKIDVFDEEEEEPKTDPEQTPNYLQDEEKPEQEEIIDIPPPPRNVGIKIDDNSTSTRE